MIKSKIVLVPFPFDDLSGAKVRPAVCLTEPIGSNRHVVIAFITSALPDDPLSTDIVIKDTHSDFRKTGLRVTSVIRLHRLTTVTTRIIHRELGRLPDDIRAGTDRELLELFKLGD